MKLYYTLIILCMLPCSALEKSPEQLLRNCKHAQLLFNQCVALYPRMWSVFCKQKQAEMWLVCRNIKEYRQQRLIRHFIDRL